MQPVSNRYLVIAWISMVLSLLSAGSLIALRLIVSALKGDGLSWPLFELYLAAIAVWASVPIVMRRPALGLGRFPPTYSPRRNLKLLATFGVVVLCLFAGSLVRSLQLATLPGALEAVTAPLNLFTLWTWMLAVTAFPAWHNDPAWGAQTELLPALPRRAGRWLRQLAVRG